MSFNVLDFVSALGAEAFDQTFLQAETQADRWRKDPVAFSEECLGVKPWTMQRDLMRRAVSKGKVLIKSGHKVGKSHAMACMALWHHYSFNPGLVVTIAPRAEHLRNILWKDMRILWQQARVPLPNHFIGPAACEMRSAPNHLVLGITANKGEAITGRHDARMLFLIDESVGVDPIYFTTIKTMFRPGVDMWICACNPTKTTSQLYAEDTSGDGWESISLSCLEHPNITGYLAGENDGETNLPYPNAVRPSQIDTWVKDWAHEVGDVLADDNDLAVPFKWRGKLYIPGPDFESRVLGMWPSQGSAGVWTESLWRHCTELRLGQTREGRCRTSIEVIPEIGCDIAGPGEDDTAIHVRWGSVSVSHESHNGWKPTRTCGRLIELARYWAEKCNQARRAAKMAEIRPEDVPIKLDDDTLSAMTSFLSEAGYKAVPIRASRRAHQETRYPNRRSELWFATREKAKLGFVWLGLLPAEVQRKLRIQLMAPAWDLDGAGRRQVEKKDDTKEKIGRSPDDADAFNLAYLDAWTWEAPTVLEQEETKPFTMGKGKNKGRAAARGLFGRK